MTTREPRNIRLEDPVQNWEKREGYLTRMSLSYTDSATTSTYFTAEELQAIVNAAARQYGIRPATIANEDYASIAREVLAELADDMRSGDLEYGPGTASHAVRDWMNERYPLDADQGDAWAGGFADNH